MHRITCKNVNSVMGAGGGGGGVFSLVILFKLFQVFYMLFVLMYENLYCNASYKPIKIHTDDINWFILRFGEPLQVQLT